MPSSLPLYPDSPFTDGDLVTPEKFYLSFYSPVFDDQPQYLGHRPRLLDSELSNDAGAIKGRVATIEGGFKVTGTGGLNLAYASGTCVLPNGDTLAVASGTLAAPDNATSFVWIDSAGNVQIGTIPPVYRTLLAKVIAATGTVNQILDYRSAAYRTILPVARSIKSFGGSSTTDFTVSAGTVLDQGTYYFRNLTIPAGVTLTVTGFAKIFCQSFTCNGTINVTAIAPGGSQQAYIASPLGTTAGLSGQGLGSNNTAYGYGAQPYGSGGQQGYMIAPTGVNVSWGYSWAGGIGGGCLWVECSGAVSVTGTITASGTNGGQGGTDPSGNVQGGVNGTSPGMYISGSGGGSGGLIYISSLTSITASATSTLDVRGGNGGNGFIQGGSGNRAILGGYGGGGGYIVLSSPANNTTGASLLVSAGTQGTAAIAGSVTGTSTVTITGTNQGFMQGGNGGAYGGNSSGYAYNGNSGGNTVLTPYAGGNGKIVLNSFIPVA